MRQIMRPKTTVYESCDTQLRAGLSGYDDGMVARITRTGPVDEISYIYIYKDRNGVCTRV
jgi:hypothetical protein